MKISNAILLFHIGVALAYHLRDTPEELREYFQDIDTEVKALYDETMVRIESNVIPLQQNIEDAEIAIVQNLTDAAKPYWATIRSLEETAAEKGQDISTCIDLGNDELYVLNSTILNPALKAFVQFEQWGNEFLNSSSSEAYGVIEELIVLEELVVECTDEVCATSLNKTITQYYQRAKNTLTDAEMKIGNYVTDYLPRLLAVYSLDSNLYVSNYTVILEGATKCINNL